MSLDRMWDGKPVTKEGYDQAFAEIRAGNGSLDGYIIARYMANDPVNAVYLQTEAIKLARETLEYHLNIPVAGFPSPFVLWCIQNHHGTWVKRDTVLKTFDAQMASPTAIRDHYATRVQFHYCIFCGYEGSLGITTLSCRKEFKPLHNMFDSTHGLTVLALQQFISRTRDDAVAMSRISGLCRTCYKGCLQCGAHMTLPQVSLETLDSYYGEHLCPSCGGNTISKLPIPKPSRTDLRAYRVKFTAFHKEV